MKKIFFVFSVLFATVIVQAQYARINAVVDRLEERHGVNQNLSAEKLDGRKFVLVKDFEDHTERSFIVINGKNATYIEIFDDKKTGQSTSNVFTGDIVRSQHNIVSLRVDELEGEKIAVPIAKTLLLTKQKKTLYLIDVNTKERWIDEQMFSKN